MWVRASTELHIDPWGTPQLNTERGEEWSVKQKKCMIWLEWSQCCILCKFYRSPYQMLQVNNGSSVSSSNIIRHTDERSPEKDVWNKTENVHRCCCAIRNASSFAVKADFETLVKFLNRVDQLSWWKWAALTVILLPARTLSTHWVGRGGRLSLSSTNLKLLQPSR